MWDVLDETAKERIVLIMAFGWERKRQNRIHLQRVRVPLIDKTMENLHRVPSCQPDLPLLTFITDNRQMIYTYNSRHSLI